jgi:hypothetical protein
MSNNELSNLSLFVFKLVYTFITNILHKKRNISQDIMTYFV